MGETITCTQVVQVGSQLTRTMSTVITVDAYDVIQATIAAGAKDNEVQVQPANTPEQVRFLLIEGEPDGLSYKVDTAADAEVFKLDSPQIFMGAGGLAMLSKKPPTSLFFSNTSTTKPAAIRILVGRNALVK